MDVKDFGQLLKDHPKMLDDGQRVSAILRDIYPSEKRNINLMVAAYNAGVVSIIRKSNYDDLLPARISLKLIDDYGLSEDKAKWAADLWVNAYYYFEHGTFREQEQPQPSPNPSPQLQKAKPPVAPIQENDPSCFEVEQTGLGCIITKYIDSDLTEVVIPAKINGKPVIEIGKEAFEDCKNLTSVTFLGKQSVTFLGRQYVTFFGRQSKITIDFDAFDNNSNLGLV